MLSSSKGVEMRSRKSRATSFALSATMIGSLLMIGAQSATAEQALVVCSDLSHQSCTMIDQADASSGAWSAPFAEMPKYGDGAGGGAAPATPEEAGELPTAVSAVVTPQGRIIYWDGLSGLESADGPLPLDAGSAGATPDRSRLLDLDGSTPLWLDPTPIDGGSPDNLFCADQRLLADGRVIVAGGTKYQTEPYADLPDEVVPDDGGPDGLAELYGSTNTRMYSDDGDAGGSWDYDPGRDMRWRRWYPALITMPDGNIIAAGGVSKLLWNSNSIDDDDGRNSIAEAPVNVKEVEMFDRGSERWSDFANPESEQSLPLFARVHLMPNGDVLYTANGQMWGPAGEDINELGWNWQKVFSITGDNKAEWSDVNMGPFGARNGATDFLMPLRPDENGDYNTMEVLVAGGTPLVSPGGYVATPFSEKITVSIDDDGDASISSEVDANLNHARWFSSGVVLPNGDALILSGADVDEVIMPGTERAVRMAELYDGEQWIELSEGSRDRTYHNSAILLPDGSVLVGGHSPINAFYGPGDPNNNALHDAGLGGNTFRDPSFERFYPPYLTAGERPDLKSSAAAAAHGNKLPFVTEDDPSTDADESDVAQVVLSRLPSVTHVTDADQRTVELTFELNTATPSGIKTWKADVPDNAAVVPPGFYYLFALSSEGVPSIATIVKIDSEVTTMEAASFATPVEIGVQQVRPLETAASDAAEGSVAKAAPAAATVAEPARDAVATLAGATARETTGGLPVAWLLAIGTLALGAYGWRRATARA